LRGGGAWEHFHGIHAQKSDAGCLTDGSNDTGVVEAVAMTTESSQNGTIDRCQRRPLQNHSSNKVPLGAVVGRALNGDGESRGWLQRRELEGVHPVGSVGHATGASAILVAFRCHVDDVCCWIDNRCSSDTNVVWDIVTSAQVGGEKR
jgi:hypothetical protein